MRQAIRPAHVKGTFHELGGFTNSGYIVSDDVLSLTDEDPVLTRERRLGASDTLSFSESLTLVWTRVLSFSDTLNFDESVNPQLAGKINAGSRATVAPARATLEAGFSMCGFGQLGFGGSIDINA